MCGRCHIYGWVGARKEWIDLLGDDKGEDFMEEPQKVTQDAGEKWRVVGQPWSVKEEYVGALVGMLFILTGRPRRGWEKLGGCSLGMEKGWRSYSPTEDPFLSFQNLVAGSQPVWQPPGWCCKSESWVGAELCLDTCEPSLLSGTWLD